MPATTPTYAWPYQVAGDAPDGAGLGQNLALAIEATLSGLAVPSLPRGIMAAPSATGANATATSGTTVTKDTALPDYVFTAVAGRRYRVIYDGLNANVGVAGDRFIISIRDGGASSPTSASPVLSHDLPIIIVTQSVGYVLTGTFTTTAGTHTLNAFYVRNAGTGTMTATGTRELYVEDIGAL